MKTTVHPAKAQVGDAIGELMFGPISRTTLALYAGASLDHNPMHIDLDFARAAGQEDVFAHGMLGMAQFGRLLTTWAGTENVQEMSTRFAAIVPIGATLTITGSVEDRVEEQGQTTLSVGLRALLDDGTCALTGKAVVRTAEA